MNTSLIRVVTAGPICALGINESVLAQPAGAPARTQGQLDRTILPILPVYPLINWSDLFPGFKKFQQIVRNHKQ